MHEQLSKSREVSFLVSRKIVLFVLSIGIQKVELSYVWNKEIDHSCAAALSFAATWVGNPNLSQAAASWHHNSSVRLLHQGLLQLGVNVIRQMLRNPFRELGCFNEDGPHADALCYSVGYLNQKMFVEFKRNHCRLTPRRSPGPHSGPYAYANLPRITSTTSPTFTRVCSSVSRSRSVTVSSASVWLSTVMQYGVPISSILRYRRPMAACWS